MIITSADLRKLKLEPGRARRHRVLRRPRTSVLGGEQRNQAVPKCKCGDDLGKGRLQNKGAPVKLHDCSL